MKFMKKYGGSVVSNNIINGSGVLKWCIREESLNDIDNGWRFLSNIDSDEFLSDSSNMSVLDFNTVVEIEPAVLKIFNMPIGTELTLMYDNGKKYFVYTENGDIL